MTKKYIKNSNYKDGLPPSGRLHFKQEFKVLKINQIEGHFRLEEFPKREVNYDWDYLRDSIADEGLLANISVRLTEKARYELTDGNHRMYILKEMFGEDYEVPCQILKPNKDKEREK